MFRGIDISENRIEQVIDEPSCNIAKAIPKCLTCELFDATQCLRFVTKLMVPFLLIYVENDNSSSSVSLYIIISYIYVTYF